MAKRTVIADPGEILKAFIMAFIPMGGLFHSKPEAIIGWMAGRIQSVSGIIFEEGKIERILEKYIKEGFVTRTETNDGEVEYRFHRELLIKAFAIQAPSENQPKTDDELEELFSQAKPPE